MYDAHQDEPKVPGYEHRMLHFYSQDTILFTLVKVLMRNIFVCETLQLTVDESSMVNCSLISRTQPWVLSTNSTNAQF